jgi:hypothetical protein
VSSILVLVGLLALSYAGTFLGGRTLRGAGLPSSVEYVALGLVLGPHLLGVVGGELVSTFEPLAQVALGWLALVIGLDFGRVGERRSSVGSMALGLAGTALTAGSVATAVWLYATRVRHAPADLERVLLAGGIGATSAETTRHAIRWASERYNAEGKLTRLLQDFAHADDLVPLLAVAVLYSLAPVPLARFHLAPWAWVAVTIGFGAALGAMTAMHLGREPRIDQTWGVLLGMSVLGVGVAARLGISVLAVLFFMGWTTAALSRHRAALRAMMAPIERPVVLPALVLAGAHVDLQAAPGLAGVVAVAVGARIAAKLLFGLVVALPRGASPTLGAGLLSSGALSLGVALAFALRFPGPIGETVLAASFVTCLVGEALGPLALKRALRGAGEIAGAPMP